MSYGKEDVELLIGNLEQMREDYITIAKARGDNPANPYRMKADGIQLAIRAVYDWIEDND